MVVVRIDEKAIAEDPQIHDLLLEAAEALARETNRNTNAPFGARHGEVEMRDGLPSVMMGAKGAAAVSVEFGTRALGAKRPYKRAADALGIEIGS